MDRLCEECRSVPAVAHYWSRFYSARVRGRNVRVEMTEEESARRGDTMHLCEKHDTGVNPEAWGRFKA